MLKQKSIMIFWPQNRINILFSVTQLNNSIRCDNVASFDRARALVDFGSLALICVVNLRGNAVAGGIESSVPCSATLGNKLALGEVCSHERWTVSRWWCAEQRSKPARNGDTDEMLYFPRDLFSLCDILLRFVSCHSLTLVPYIVSIYATAVSVFC